MVTKKLAIMMGYECNNNCIFCYAGDKKSFKAMTTEEVKKELEKGINRGCDYIDFNGGEPTIRKDIFELVRYAKQIGYYTVAMTTNGRMFSYEKFTKEIVKCGLNSAVFSIHGHTSELHDYLTNVKGSFKQACQGLKNLRKIKPNAYICTNTTINKLNFKFLPQIAENNIKIGANACEFIFIHPRGNALRNFDKVVPSLTEIEPYIKPTIEVGKKHSITHFVMRYFPLCFMIGEEDSLSELMALETLREQHVGPEFYDLEVEKGRATIGRVKGTICVNCKSNDKCEGIFREYGKRIGFKELRPI